MARSTQIVVAFLILVSCTLIASANQTNDSDKYTFTNYGGEEFTPQPMQFGENLVTEEAVVMSTSSTTLENGSARKHMMLQFYENTTGEQIELLDSYGLLLLNVAADYTFIFSMPADLTAADLPAESGLRWMGEIPVENKYDRNYGLDVPEWAKLEDGNIQLSIEFFEDISYQDALNIATEYSAANSTPENIMPNYYSIKTDESNINAIASEDAVFQVNYIGSEPVPANDGYYENSRGDENGLENDSKDNILLPTENTSSNENKESPG